MVAATSVVGSQCGASGIGVAIMPWLLALAALLWVFLLYGFLAAITLRSVKPAIRQGLNGSWLLIVVATESLAVLASYITPLGGGLLRFAALAAFLLGGVLYVLLSALILYRFAFLPMSPQEVEGPWWINMGAVAIATLAGSRLMLLPTIDPHVAALRGAAGPITVLLWATATFWIPLLAALFVWKHAVRREPLRYDPGLWSIVFPLGMYTAATAAFSQGAELPFLRVIPEGFFWLAFPAWLLCALGMLSSIRRLRLVQ
jgi:tellurite resistance protein TehA-like permease